jgi:ubiquitin carboxyl-terminal hydrolase L3
LDSRLAFTDVFGLDEELLNFVPRPVYALSLLFPCAAASSLRDQLNARALTPAQTPEKMFYTKQKVGNACGTVAAIHILANVDPPCLAKDSPLSKFISSVSDKTPEERAELMESDADLAKVHEQFASQGQTAAPNAEDKIDQHFIALIPFEGKLFELDGAKDGPVEHGQISDKGFLVDASKVCQKYIDAAEGNLNFAIMALVESSSLL